MFNSDRTAGGVGEGDDEGEVVGAVGGVRKTANSISNRNTAIISNNNQFEMSKLEQKIVGCCFVVL